MKLRFVKFLTSRENEIERKEEGGRSTALACSTVTQLARNHSPAPALPFSLHHFILSPSTQPRQPTSSVAPACRPPRVGRARLSSYPSPAVPLLPSFFIKLLKQHSVEGRTVAGTYLADSAVLLNDNRAAPSSPHPCSFIQSDGRGFSPVPMAPSLWRLEP